MGDEPTYSSVASWLPGYVKELNYVTNKRLTELSNVNDEIKRRAMPLRMILERKRDGRRKGRGGQEPN